MILLAYGTRPEWIKTKPIIGELKKNSIEYKILFTGQQVNIGEFEHDWIIQIENDMNRLDSIVSSITDNYISEFLAYIDGLYGLGIVKTKVTHIMVQGDTTSAMAVALSAFHHGIKVIHLEAGLRTYDKQNPYPEEVNRRIISQIADIHLCPTTWALKNLTDEMTVGDMYVVGNTVIDNLLQYKDKCEYTNKILVTLHRRENHSKMTDWFLAVDSLAKWYPQYEFILPLHPNPNVQKHRNLLKSVKVIDPLPYEEMLDLLVKCRLVITDSGGLQEESCFFNKICLTCRTVTERPEAIGLSSHMVKNPENLLELFVKFHNNYKIDVECPFGDGHAAEKIMEILKTL
jgi:UDP-N-acetylglucosamine 2-epimerase (non-hydrolysing)